MGRAAIILMLTVFPALAGAQEFRALARALSEGSAAVDAGARVEITLALTQSVPFRVVTYDAPRRVVIDAREVDWSGLGAEFDQSQGVARVTVGRTVEAPGWSRMALELSEPFAVESAAMVTDTETGEAQIAIVLRPTSAEDFAAGATEAPQAALTVRPEADARFVIALDPGHGGVDPGAEAGGVREADLMLTFARELAEALIRTGQAEVVLTRQDDSFVSLPARISIARAAGADMFISLHADAIAFGRASGATVYTLSEEASDAASASLAEQFDRTDILHGV
ncbi:MAG: N-acetylmuramoyl-L-alanine amidase, partial [Pseudomonadota bacterium]